MTKQITAMVYEDGQGGEGTNGDKYAMTARSFRVNMRQAKELLDKSGDAAAYLADMKSADNANVKSYQRTNNLTEAGTIKLDSDGGFKDIDRSLLVDGYNKEFSLTFSVAEEPATKITVKMLVSNANHPVLHVPASKQVSVGADFPEGAQADSTPSYMQGVYATDEEDNNEELSAGITHDETVDTSVEDAYTVTYRVTVTDDNTATKAGVVLVGDAWVVKDGYGIRAYDFEKRIGQVDGTTAQAISYARAEAIDLRQTLSNGKDNPDFGRKVAVDVASDSGYSDIPVTKAADDYLITYKVADNPSVTVTTQITATVVTGESPVLTATTPLEIWIGKREAAPGTAIDAAAWNADNNYAVTISDVEDTMISKSDVTFTEGSDTVDTTKVGVYAVTYTVTDSDNNTVTANRTVVVNDGSYTVNPEQGGRILAAHSFIIKKEDVAQAAEAKEMQIKSLTGVTLHDGVTGAVLDGTCVRDDGGYTDRAGTYDITVGGADAKAAGGFIEKRVTGKVVDADVIEGPVSTPAGVSGGDRYYAYGNNIRIHVAEAKRLTSDELILNALDAHADRVSPLGEITDARAVIAGIEGPRQSGTGQAQGAALEQGEPGLYKVTVADSDGNVSVVLQISVTAGEPPVIDVPRPIVIPVDPDNPGTLGREDIMEGVEATDPDGNPGDLPKDVTDEIVLNPDDKGDENLPKIKADEPGVIQVTYFVEDEDGNQYETTAAVVVDDGSFVMDDDYILQARDFRIRAGDVNLTDATSQILTNSQAGAWDTAGNKRTAVVIRTDGYVNRRGEYKPAIGISGYGGLTKQITALVVDEFPTLTVPAYRIVAKDAAFGEAQYMDGVRATDPEDGDITARVTHDRYVNTAKEGYYLVNYAVTDSYPNTVRATGVVLVGDSWKVVDGYAIYAYDFTRPLSQVTGRSEEMIGAAGAQAVCIDPDSPNFGYAVTVSVAADGGYAAVPTTKKAGDYNITFTIAGKTIEKAVVATVSDDTPPVVVPDEPKTEVITKVVERHYTKLIREKGKTTRIVINNPPVRIIEPPVEGVEPTVITVPAVAAPYVAEIPGTDTPKTNYEPPVVPTPAGAWHLVDLILAALSLLIGLYLMVLAVRRKRDEDDGFDDYAYRARNEWRDGLLRRWGVLGILLGLASVTALIATQDFAGTMTYADSWTILFGAIFGVEALAAVGVSRAREATFEYDREA
jgi:hypothetical protein